MRYLRGYCEEIPYKFRAKIAIMGLYLLVFTARCTLVQSAVLRSHVVCLSVRLSVCNVGEL